MAIDVRPFGRVVPIQIDSYIYIYIHYVCIYIYMYYVNILLYHRLIGVSACWGPQNRGNHFGPFKTAKHVVLSTMCLQNSC